MIIDTNRLSGIGEKIKFNYEFPVYNQERANLLKKLARKRQAEKLQQKEEKTYKAIFERLTGKVFAVYSKQFVALIEQFGEDAIQETVEYMLMRNSNGWKAEEFLSYLLKALQSKRVEPLFNSITEETLVRRKDGDICRHERRTFLRQHNRI